MLSIITACSRPQNLRQIYESIDFQKVDTWYIIYDTSKCRTYDFQFTLDSQAQKIIEMTCDKEGAAGHPQINFALDLIQDGFVYSMDDDNIFHKTFWTLLPTLDKEYIYTWDQLRMPSKTFFKGGQIKADKIDTSQFIVPRSLIGASRWAEQRLYGDFRFISQIYKKHKDKFKYIPKIACYHNFINKPRVALCFFGLTRSLKFTIGTIQKYLLGPLKNNGIRFEIFLHSYKMKTPYTNPRAGENQIILDTDEYKLLEPDYKMLETKEMVSSRINLAKYRAKGDPWSQEEQAIPGDFTTLDNHILYLWSQKQLVQMVLNQKKFYTHIVFCRPDVLYEVPFQVNWLRFDSDKIFIPNFGLCGNMNDRFAVGQRKQMIQYGSRFDNALEYSKKKPLASEAYLIDTMRKHQIKYEHVNFYFTRVRANGKKNGMDLGQIRKLTRRKGRGVKKGTRKHLNGYVEISRV